MNPTFLIIGAPRCGTTMLYEELKRHPDVFVSPIKEPSFFAPEGTRAPFENAGDPTVLDLETYQALFAGARENQAIGEASPLYLYSPRAPFRIQAHAPNAKLIAVLRDPVERAYSHFLLHRLWGLEDIAGLQAAVEAEDDREQMGRSAHWFYRRVGLYGEQLARYLSIFPREQMKVFLFEDLEQSPQAVIEQILEFLNLDRRFQLRAPRRVNVAGAPRSSRLHTFLTAPNLVSKSLTPFVGESTRRKMRSRIWDEALEGLKQWNLRKPPLDRQVRGWLIDFYRADILRAQDILQRDLSSWLNE